MSKLAHAMHAPAAMAGTMRAERPGEWQERQSGEPGFAMVLDDVVRASVQENPLAASRSTFDDLAPVGASETELAAAPAGAQQQAPAQAPPWAASQALQAVFQNALPELAGSSTPRFGAAGAEHGRGHTFAPMLPNIHGGNGPDLRRLWAEPCGEAEPSPTFASETMGPLTGLPQADGISDGSDTPAKYLIPTALVLHQEAHFRPVRPQVLFNDDVQAEWVTVPVTPERPDLTVGLRPTRPHSDHTATRLPQLVPWPTPLSNAASPDATSPEHGPRARQDADSGNERGSLAAQPPAPPNKGAHVQTHGFAVPAPAPALSFSTSDPAGQLNRSLEPTQSADIAKVQLCSVVRASGNVTRTLHLQLRPVALGSVTVEMKLTVNEQLEVTLQTETQEAADLLRKDSGLLASLLRVSGYTNETLSISVMGPDASSQRTPLASSGFSSPDGSPHRNAGGQSGSGEQRERLVPPGGTMPDQESSASLRNIRSSAGDLYL